MGRAVRRPAVLLSGRRARRNIARMAGKARSLGLAFRPHFKTHQSAAVGRWFGDEGTRAIAVSSLAMAEYFADYGWRDLTLAIPLNLRALPRAGRMARNVRLGVTVDSERALAAVAGMPEGDRPDVWIELDCGDGRTGARWDDAGLLDRLVRSAREQGLRLRGLLSHAGQTYSASGPDEVLKVHAEALGRVRRGMQAAGVGDRLEISWGDTPSCALAEDFGPATELRPGNFVFFDLMQMMLGSCSAHDIAVSVLCPVISTDPQEERAVLYGGAVHLSKEYLTLDGGRVYGALARPESESPFEPDLSLPLVRLSQEHGLVRGPRTRMLRPGDLVSVVPVHSCLACNLYSGYLLEEGGRVERMVSCRGGAG